MGSKVSLKRKERSFPRRGAEEDKRFSLHRLGEEGEEEEPAELVFEAEELIKEESVSYGQSSSRLAILNMD
jgi:hypothetical protein